MRFPASSGIRTLAFVTAIMATPAVFAHAHLKDQYPAANAEVTAAPQTLTLTFSEGIEPKFSGVTVTGAQQQSIKTGAVKRDNENKMQMIVPLEQALPAGKYTVDWHVVSVDGHKTRGTYTFTVK